MALVARDAGADAISRGQYLARPPLCESRRRRRLGNGNGGVSGPALLPVGVLAAARVVERTGGMPVIGVGGVRSADDVRQYLRVGRVAGRRSARRRWPIRGCPSGSFETWSVDDG